MEAGPEDIERACLEWVNTFGGLSSTCTSFHDLKDGVVLVAVLNEIAPESFLTNSIGAVASDNWVLRASNIRTVLRLIDEYYRTVLLKCVDVSSVNANAIAKECDHEEVVSLLELILGAAVQCDDKAEFIGAIFALEEMSQLVLKGMVEAAMGRSSSLEDEDEEGGFEGGSGDESGAGGGSSGGNNSNSAGSAEDLLRAQEMVRHLQDEKTKLVSDTASLERSNDDLQGQLDTVAAELEVLKRDRAHAEGSDRTRTAAVEQANAQMALDLDDAKRELDLKMVRIEDLDKELGGGKKALLSAKEAQAKLEMENARMGDELDLAKDKGAKLAKAEAAVEKYSKRLEEMSDIKKHSKELETQMDGYLDKIMELENGNKSIATLNKMIEQYKDKSVTSEREKFEAISALELKDHQLGLKQGQLNRALEAKRLSDEELRNARGEFEQLESARQDDDAEEARSRKVTAAALEGLPEGETVTSLMERVARLSADVESERRKQSALAAAQGEASAGESMLRAELDLAEKAKREREAELVASRQEVAELSSALDGANAEAAASERRAGETAAKAQRQAAEAARAAALSSQAAESAGALEALEAKLAAAEQATFVRDNTMRLLEEQLKEKEGQVNKLQQDKNKLESFAKDSLKNFKDKYLKELTKFRTEKKDWKDKYNAILKVNERNQETYRREERLLLSSMYEIGVRILDRNIQTVEGGAQPSSFLATQRATLGEK